MTQHLYLLLFRRIGSGTEEITVFADSYPPLPGPTTFYVMLQGPTTLRPELEGPTTEYPNV